MEKLNEKLLSAAEEGNNDLILECIHGGASVNCKDSQGWTPLHKAAYHRQDRSVQILMGNGADIQARTNQGWTPLHHAARYGGDRSVQILMEGGADVHARTNMGRTPLHLAAGWGGDRSVQILVEGGADVHARMDEGWTPLHWAAEKGQDRSVQILVEGGADIHARNNRGATPLHQAAWKGHDRSVQTLMEGGADVHARMDEGWTPLHWAAQEGQDRSVQILMEGGADVHARMDEGWTPLHLAAGWGGDRSVQILVEGGADVHARDNKGWTPLHLAAQEGQDRSVQILIEGGADVHARTNMMLTPLFFASKKLKDFMKETAEIKEFEGRFLTPGNSTEFKVLISRGTYKSYHNRVYFAGACNVGKSTLASNFIGENILHHWKSTNGLIIFFGRNGIDLKLKKMVPLEKGHLDSILSSVLRGKPSVENSSKKQSLKKVLKRFQMFFKKSKRPTPTSTHVAESSNVLSNEEASSLQGPGELLKKQHVKEDDLLARAPTRCQLPSDLVKHEPSNIHESMKEEIKRGEYKIQIAPSDLVDFGGQRSFDMTHQLFIQQKGAFVLLLDGRKDFEDALSEYKHEDMTTKDIILHWVNSILTYCSIDDDDIYPLIVFAATHKDELTKEEQHKKSKEITRKLQETFREHEFRKRIKFDQVFFINATDREDPGVQSLKEYLVNVAFQQKSWGEKMPVAWVPLELQMAEMRSSNIFVISIDELVAVNMSNEELALSDTELKYFLRCQHSFGQILYFSVQKLDQYIIVQPTAMVDILRSFITDEIFWPSEPALHDILSTGCKHGIIKRGHLYQLWEQEEFNKYVSTPEIKEFTAQVLVHLDILVEPKRFHETEESLTETFIVPCMIKQHFPYTQFPYNLDDDKTIFLSYKLSKSLIPNALIYKMIGAALNIWPLKKEDEKLCLYDKAAILTIDQNNDLYLIYSEDRFIVGLSNSKSKSHIPPDVASVIQECLTLTLTKVLTFYYKSFGQSTSNLDVSDCFETEVVLQCGENKCFTRLSDINDKPQWTCQHKRKHQTKFPLYWIFDQMGCELPYFPSEQKLVISLSENKYEIVHVLKKLKMCLENCTGFDIKCLDEIPEDKHLIRLARRIGREFYEFIIHLGLEKIEWNDIEENRAYDDKLTQRFFGLCKWKTNQQARNISPTFRDLSKALSGIKYTEHYLCQVFREERTEVYAFNSSRLQEVPDDNVLEELSHTIGYHTFELGVELGLELPSIEETAVKYFKDMFGQTFDILIKWKTSSKVSPTVRSLMHALQYVDSRGFIFLKEKYDVEQNS